MSKHIAIALDGPAASGKSTLARELAKKLNLTMVNSGEMYRAVTWKILQLGVNPSDHAAVVDALNSMDIKCGIEDGFSTIAIDGVRLGSELRTAEVNGSVSFVSAVPEVRERLVNLQRGYLEYTDVVMEGRDIGTVVFPDTPFKIYVDADPNARAQRRVDAGEVDSIHERDKEDSQRKTAPLKVADGAVLLDTSPHSIESMTQAAMDLLETQGLNIDRS